jgi:integrase
MLGRHGHGSWYFRLELEVDVDGNRRTVRRGGFQTQSEAQDALDAAKGKAAKGVDVKRRITTGEYLTEWLAGKANIRPTTRRSYAQHIEDYLIPSLGRIELGTLRPAHVSGMFQNVAASPATRQRIRATLRAALNQAERENLVVINAARLVEMESGRRPPVQPLQPAELGRLLDSIASDELGPLLETIASTGPRRGEALAVRWGDDVDLDVGVVHVRRQLVQLAGRHPCESCYGHVGVMVSTPKTSSGVRTIELDAHTLGTLLDQRLRQDADRTKLGTADLDHDLVFAQEDRSRSTRRW